MDGTLTLKVTTHKFETPARLPSEADSVSTVKAMPNIDATTALPPAQGLYDPRFEHDSCGIGFVSHIKGHKSHDIIVKGIEVLINLTHRGACGCDPETGDGAGILIQIPHKFFARECVRLGFTLPPAAEYGLSLIHISSAGSAR